MQKIQDLTRNGITVRKRLKYCSMDDEVDLLVERSYMVGKKHLPNILRAVVFVVLNLREFFLPYFLQGYVRLTVALHC